MRTLHKFFPVLFQWTDKHSLWTRWRQARQRLYFEYLHVPSPNGALSQYSNSVGSVPWSSWCRPFLNNIDNGKREVRPVQKSERIEIDDFNCFGPPGYFSAFRASTNICTIDHMAKPSEPINGCIPKSLSFKFKKAADLSCPSPCALTGLTTRTFSTWVYAH